MRVEGRLVDNFSLEEMMCRDGSLVLTPQAVEHAQRLQKFRLWYNRHMKVNSWYRSPDYNKHIGGAPKSKHMECIATDIALPYEFSAFSAQRKREFITNLRNKWAELCKEDGLGGGFGYYKESSFFHCDSRIGESLTYWEV
jgi:uncharacterized protein YcbK (DUF882 family)